MGIYCVRVVWASAEPSRKWQTEPVSTNEANYIPPSQVRAHARKSKEPKKGSLLKEMAIVVTGAFILSWLLKTFLIQAFYIPSQSMEDTLQINDRIMVSKLSPSPVDLQRGDIVVFTDPGTWLPDSVKEVDLNPVQKALTFIGILPQDAGSHLIKRVIGLPGDRVVCCDTDGKLTVNGEPIDETEYLKPFVDPSLVEFDQIVPEGSLWVLGDNRANSGDSRYNLGGPGGGFVPIDNVVGKAFIKVWPLRDFQLLRTPSSVFEDVPQP